MAKIGLPIQPPLVVALLSCLSTVKECDLASVQLAGRCNSLPFRSHSPHNAQHFTSIDLLHVYIQLFSMD